MFKLLRLMGFRPERFSLYNKIKPYDYAANIAMHRLHAYAHCAPEEVTRVCIVGVHNGFEVPPLLKNYPNVHVHMYEASPRYTAILERKYRNSPRATVRPVAVSDQNGTMTFHETTRHGNGSLLPLDGSVGGMSQAEQVEVETVRLDDDYPADHCDMLWLDIQGAELMALRGAEKLLRKTKTAFVEVSRLPLFYEGACTMDEVTEYLAQFDLHLALLGVDSDIGNAFYTRIKT